MAGSGAADEALDARIEILDEEELKKKLEEEEDEAIVRQVFSKIPDPSSVAGPSSIATPSTSTEDGVNPVISTPSTITIKRRADFLEPEFGALVAEAAKAAIPKSAPPSKKKKTDLASALGIKRPNKSKAKA